MLMWFERFRFMLRKLRGLAGSDPELGKDLVIFAGYITVIFCFSFLPLYMAPRILQKFIAFFALATVFWLCSAGVYLGALKEK